MSHEMCHLCTASLIVVGDEILRGQIVDTNTSYLARSLTAAGVSLQRVVVVPDVVRITLIKEIWFSYYRNMKTQT